MKKRFVTDLAQLENQSVEGFFVAVNRQLRTKADASTYLSLTLQDRSGQLEARMWDLRDAGASIDFASGDILKVRGLVCRYQDKLQIKIDRLRRADPSTDSGEYDLSDFVPTTRYDIDTLWSTLTDHVDSLSDPHLKALLQLFLADPRIAAALREAPAAKALHHAWIGGLLEHVVSLLALCDSTAAHYQAAYPGLLNRDLLLSGAILHDIGKIHELQWGTSFSYTTSGQLLGHITLGASMVEEKIAQLPGFPPRLRVVLLHMVLSHHGHLEFGSPKLPMTPEAILLHYLDDLDAKMQTLQTEFARAAANGAAPGAPTDYIRSMERPLLHASAWLAADPDPRAESDPILD